MMHKLTLNNVSKAFNGVPALNDVSITLLSGRTHALMGENGAGKSTLIKLLAGVINADSMSIFRDKEHIRITNTIDATSAGFRFIHQNSISYQKFQLQKTSSSQKTYQRCLASKLTGRKYIAEQNSH